MSIHQAFSALLGLILIFALLAGCTDNPQSAQEKIDRLAKDMQAELPKMLDQETKLVNVYTNKLELVSEYELVNYNPDAIDKEGINKKIEYYLRGQVCPGIKKELLNIGVSSRYIYKGNDGRVIGEWLISPGDC